MSGRAVVLCTVGSAEDAERIAGALVDRGLAACVNVVPGVTSFYRWKGETARDSEWLLVMKTTVDRFEALRRAVRQVVLLSDGSAIPVFAFEVKDAGVRHANAGERYFGMIGRHVERPPHEIDAEAFRVGRDDETGDAARASRFAGGAREDQIVRGAV